MSKEPKKNPYEPKADEIVIQPNGTAIDPDATRPLQANVVGKLMDDLGLDKKVVGKFILDIAKDEISERIGVGRRHTHGRRTAFQQIVDAVRELWWVPVVVFLTGGFSLLLLKLLYKWAGV